MFYDGAGVGELYEADEAGGIERVDGWSTWRSTWDEVMAVRLSGSVVDKLLFHDRGEGGNAGVSTTELYSTSDGSLGVTTWPRSWHTVVPLHIAQGGAEELFLYDRAGADWELRFFDADHQEDFTPHSAWDPVSEEAFAEAPP